jgi:hypothetical protein
MKLRACPTSFPDLLRQIEFRRETLPSLAALEREWRALETTGRLSFFTSWQWIGTLLSALPDTDWPDLLRDCAGDRVLGSLYNFRLGDRAGDLPCLSFGRPRL